MIQPSGIYFQAEPNRPILPLINPEAQTYVDLIEQLGLPESVIDCGPFIAPDGEHLWLSCAELVDDAYNAYFEPTYLVALPSLETIPVSGKLEFRGWSTNGRFLAYNKIDDEETRIGSTWLMTTEGEQWQVAEQLATYSRWHSLEPLVAFGFDDDRLLQFVQAETNQNRLLAFAQPIKNVIWQPTNGAAVLLTENGSLWWLADPFDPNDEPVQITPPLPEPHIIRWSPNDRLLALVSGVDLFIVEIASE